MVSLLWSIRPDALLISGVVLLAVGLYQLWIYLVSRHPARRIGGAFANIFVMLALILLMEDVSRSLAKWSGLPNIGWYLGYVMGANGCYLFARLAYVTDIHSYGPQLHRLLRTLLIGLLLLLSLIYVTHLMHQPEWPARTPRTMWALLFSTSYFFYCMGIAVAVGLTIWTAIPREENPAQRLRLWVCLWGCGTSLVCFVSKQLYLTLSYLGVELTWINQTALLALVVTGLWFSVAVSPGWLLRLLISLNPITYLRHLWQLYWLRKLSMQIYALMPARIWRRQGWIGQLCRSRLAIYQSLIATLDGRNQLAACLHMAPHQQKEIAGIAWRAKEHQQAVVLHQRLQRLDHLGDEPYPLLVKQLVQISRQVRNVCPY